MDLFYPLQFFADFVTETVLHLSESSYVGQALNFFIYDTLKIGLLLVIINYLMAIVRYYLPVERIRDVLTKRRWYGLDYLLAALLGVITPFCSCSSIPLFIGFVSVGVPLGVTFTFLISSPLINESSLALFPALFGMKTTILYNVIGVGVSVFGGVLIQKLKMEKYIEPSFLNLTKNKKLETVTNKEKISVVKLLQFWWQDGFEITKQVFPYVLIGVFLGAIIHGFVPADFIEHTLSNKSWWVVPVATLLGIPLYANSVSVIPIVEVLAGKGVPLGTALAFMTAIVTLSIPEALMLKKVMKWQLLLLFFGITTIGILLIGYIFNLI